MCIRGLGAFTKTGSVYLTAATSGGAIVPAIMSAVIRSRGVQYGFCVVAAFFTCAAVLPVYLEVFPAAKAQVDPVRESLVPLSSASSHSTIPSRPKKRRFLFGGLTVRRREVGSELPTTQDHEKKQPR